MSDLYRYRVIEPSFSRLLSFAVVFLAAFLTSNIVLLMPAYIAQGLILAGVTGVMGMGFSEVTRVMAALGVIGLIAVEIGSLMLALWATSKWGRFVGAELKFVRPNLVDVANATRAE